MNEGRTCIIAVYRELREAERAIGSLRGAGFDDAEIGVVARDAAAEGADFRSPMAANVDRDRETEATETTGAVAGAAVGGLVGAAAALLIPGIGPVVASGIAAAALGGAAVGAVGGGLVAAWTELGVDEEDARRYERELAAGRALVVVRADERAGEALTTLRRAGGEVGRGATR